MTLAAGILLTLRATAATPPDALVYLSRPATTPGAPAEVAVAWPGGGVDDVVFEGGDGARVGPLLHEPTGARVMAWPEEHARSGWVRARVKGADGRWHDAGRVSVASSGALRAPTVSDLSPGADTASVVLPGGASVPESARVLRASEGSLAAVRDDGRGDLVVTVRLGPERTARVLAVAMLDARTPGALPTVAVVRVHARTELAFQTEPGATAVVRVGRRTLGPFTAGEDGRIVAPVDVGPADTAWELQATDAAGNAQRTTGPLPTRVAPVLLALDPANPTEDAAWLFGWRPGGTPLATAPACVGDGGVRPQPIPVDEGVWRVRYPGGSGAVECAAATSSATMRAARAVPGVERLALAVRPAGVSVDFPYAQVEAAVVDTRGSRMPPEGLDVRVDGAAVGPLLRTADAVTAEIDARESTQRGTFVVEATWTAPPSRDIAAALDVQAWRDGTTTRARVGVRDARAMPVTGATVRIEAGGHAHEGVTDDRGDAWFDLPGGTAPLLRAICGSLQAWTTPQAGALPPPVRGPDLTERREVRMVAGRALSVELPSPAGTVRLGDRVFVRARVRDASGAILADVVPRLHASRGRVDAPSLQGDTWVAAWSDDGQHVLGEVTVRAAVGGDGSDGPSAVARWTVQPPPVQGSIALSVGGGWNGGVVTPVIGGALHTRARWLPELLSLRVGVTGQSYEGRARGATDATSATVEALMLPVDVGLSAGRRDGRRSIDAHVSLLVAPYRVQVRYADQVTLTGLGLSDAGVAVGGSAGWRTGRTELYGEVRYSIYGASSPLLSFERPLGGPSAGLGYRFPW
jgi:hypothetical protein